MDEKLIKICCDAKYQARADLCEDIWCTIVAHDKRILRLRLWVFSLIGTMSLIGSVWALENLSTNLTKSGFYEYLALTFSSGGVVVNFLKDILLSLGESLPLISIIISLSFIFIFFLSLRHLARQINRNQLLLSF